ncbi:LOW QUALITY PROTEIN: gem-associated protein 5 isoform X2 [Vespula squamosa]|uniref:Gem-associated protein 5 isoform X2 n=1 Tax=Vespula squamosa TaxID=30214 RepID=A0ABD1ZU46_VESSQ
MFISRTSKWLNFSKCKSEKIYILPMAMNFSFFILVILFYNYYLKEFDRSISIMNIGMHFLICHPNSTATYFTFSSLRNYMTIIYNATRVTILDFLDLL